MTSTHADPNGDPRLYDPHPDYDPTSPIYSRDPESGLQPPVPSPWLRRIPAPVKPAYANGRFVLTRERDLAAEARPHLTGDPSCSHCGARLDPKWCNALAPDDVARMDAAGIDAPTEHNHRIGFALPPQGCAACAATADPAEGADPIAEHVIPEAAVIEAVEAALIEEGFQPAGDITAPFERAERAAHAAIRAIQPGSPYRMIEAARALLLAAGAMDPDGVAPVLDVPTRMLGEIIDAINDGTL